jgi:hypothetical protein
MITKTKFWAKVKSELKEVERSKKVTANVMKLIKDIPQNEDQSRTPTKNS